MFMLHFKFFSILSAILLLALTQISSRSLDTPLVSINRSTIIDEIEVPRQNLTTNNPANDSVFIGPTRFAKRPIVFTKNGLSAARRVKSYALRGSSGSSMERLPWTSSDNHNTRDSINANRTVNPSGAATISRKQFGVRHKYPNNHSYAYRTDNDNDEKSEYYSNYVENEQQSQDYESDYYSEGNYHTISEDQSGNDFENLERDPWRVSYSLPNTGYFLPSISTNSLEDNPPVMLRGCNCPSRSTRSHECGNPSNTFLNLLFALGQNFWTLIRLIISSSIPFIIPLIVLKLIIIPLKILKFIKLIKLFFKFFVLLPFLLRFIFPAFPSTFSLPNFLLQSILGTPLSYSDPRQSPPHDHNKHNIDRSNNTNTSPEEEDYSRKGDTWNLRACPNRVACEFGALLSTPADTFALQKIANYLLKMAGWVGGREGDGDTGGGDKEFGDNRKANDEKQRNEVLRAFLIGLSKSWPKDKCEIYNCAMLFEK